MHLFVYSAHSIAICDFEFGEILVLRVESLFEVRNTFDFLTLPELQNHPFQLEIEISFQISEYFEEFGMAILVLPVVFDGVLVEQIEHHLVDVEFEGQEEERGEEVADLDLFGNLLDEAHLVDLPLDGRPRLVAHLLLSGLVLPHLSPHSRMFPHPAYCYPLLHVDLEYFEEEIIEEYLFLPAAEETFGFDVVVESETYFTFGHDIV